MKMAPKKPAGERYGTPLPEPPPPEPPKKTRMDYKGALDETGRFVWTGVDWQRIDRSPFAAGFQGCFGVGAAVLLVVIVLLVLATHR